MRARSMFFLDTPARSVREPRSTILPAVGSPGGLTADGPCRFDLLARERR